MVSSVPKAEVILLMHEKSRNKHIELEADKLDPTRDISIKPQIARM